MASICPTSFPSARTDPNLNQLNLCNFRLSSVKNSSIYNISRVPESSICCRCHGDDGSQSRSWEFDIQEAVKNAIKGFDDLLSSIRDRRVNERSVETGKTDDDLEDWDWERWRKHFEEVEEQERLISVLKSQLARAVKKEDYEEAARLKVAIAASSTNDAVSRVMSYLKKYVEDERYGDAAILRDYAGAGLVGWWAGISKDGDTPYGRIIRISAEYGRYVARSYSPRQLATTSDGSPLFEVYLTNNKKGQYKQQAVYLKRKGAPQNIYIPPFKLPGSSRDLSSRDAIDKKAKLSEGSSEDSEDGEGEDDDLGFDDVLKDMIPGVRVKVVKVTAPEKVDRDMISKAIEQIIDEEEEEKDYDLEDDDGDDDGTKSENEERDDVELDSGSEIRDEDEQNQIAVEVIFGDGFIPRISRDKRLKELCRVPARLERKDRFTFTFTVEEDENDRGADGDGVGLSQKNKRIKLQNHRSMDNVMLDLVKSIGKGKIPMKVLKDVSELINLTLNQSRNRQPLSGSTTFNRLDGSSSSDPLNGLYIGAHGLYTSEVIHMKRRFGQWKDDGKLNSPSKIEFYEYVEAVKLTGDAYVPAGQVAFRAKIGKSYELPHKGIIPEEFGVIARYKGQGRLAEPGFQNPRWVDGELVILDGKYIKGGPVVGFVYWAPEYHFLVFFNRLRLHD